MQHILLLLRLCERTASLALTQGAFFGNAGDFSNFRNIRDATVKGIHIYACPV